MKGLDPVASNSRSYGVRVPSPATTIRRARSMPVTVHWRRRRMPWLAYQASSFSTMSCSVRSPVSTGDSRMRL